MNWKQVQVSVSLPIVAASISSLLATGMAVTALGQAPPGMTQISGKYTNENVGVEVVFPDGWTGFETSFGSTLAATVTDPSTADSDFPKSMTLSVIAKAEAKDPAQAKAEMEKSDVKCNDPTITSVQISGKSGQLYTIECTRPDGTQYKLKGAFVTTESRQVTLMYMAKAADFAADEGKFDAALNTLKVEGAMDSAGATNLGLELKSVIHSVLVKGKNVDLALKTTSTISNFKLEEQNKKLSFTVDGQSGTQGVTEIPVGHVLEGPYVVTIDGQSTTNFQVTNEGTSEATIKIMYTHSTHEITVSGTNVVPEFPAVMMGVIAAIVGAAAVAGRTSLFRTRI